MECLISVIFEGFMVGGGRRVEDGGGRSVNMRMKKGLIEDNKERMKAIEYETVENIKVKQKKGGERKGRNEGS